MIVELSRDYTFEAAHHLPLVADGHQCKNMHGHSYRVTVIIAGEIRPDGMLLDYQDIDRMVAPVIAQLDHTTLNATLSNPTVENLAVHLWHHFHGLPLTGVTVAETGRAACTYRGGDR